MKNKAKLILASAVFVAALMLLVPLAQIDMSGGGGIGNSDSDPIVLSDESDNSTPTELTSNNFKTSIEAGGSFKLAEDISNAEKITVSNNTVLDLNGHTLKFSNGSDEYGFSVAPGATLTINDSVGNGIIQKVIGTSNADTSRPVILAGTDEGNASNTSVANVVLNKCIIKTIDSNGNLSTTGYGVYAANYSHIKSTGYVEISAGYSAISGNGQRSGATIEIDGGKYTSNTSAAIFFPSTSTLTVTGGEFIGKTGFDIRAGTVSISNATITLNEEGTIDETGSSGPSSWGMGVAVIDNSSYAPNSDITVTINNVTVTGAEYDVYVGNLNIGDSGSFITDNFNEPFTLNHKIFLTVSKDNTNVLKYDAEKSSSIGRIISSIDGVIEVNSIETLQNAVKLCSGTIKLTSAIDFTTDNSNPIKFLEKATLDLNGNTLTLSGLNRIEVGAGGDLTITDSSTNSVGKISYTVEDDENSAIKVAGNSTTSAKLTLEKCEIVVNKNDIGNGYGVYAASYSEVTSGDGVTITAGYSAISGNGLNSGAKINITGGSYISNNSAAIYFPSTNKLTVTGGTFTGKTGFDIRAGTVDISGAEIIANGSYTNVADDSDSTRTDIPTVWGMGIAIIDHASYSENTQISVTLSNLTFTGTSVCDLYIGNFNQDAGKFDKNNLDQTFTVNKNITVDVTDVLKYSVEKSANATSGYLIVNDLDASNKTFTVTNLFNKGNATVENKGTIVVNDIDGLRSAATIGGNIQLAANITIEGMTTFLTLADKTVFDLNGKTITMSKTCVDPNNSSSSSINRLLVNNGNVTIKNGSIVDNAASTDRSPIIVNAGSGSGGSGTPKLIIDNVKITSENEYGIVVFTGELEVKNNSSITAKLSAISGNGTMAGSNITLNGGTYTSTTTAAIFFPSTTNLIVNGGTFTGATGFDIRAGTVSITNAKIVINIPSGSTTGSTGTSGPSSWKMGIAVIDHSAYASGTAISVTISGTTVTGALYDLYIGDLNRNDNGTFKGIDGTFNQDHKITVKVNGNTVYDKVAGSDYNRFTSDISSGSSGGGVPITPPTDDPEPEPIIPDENNNVTVPSIDDKKADELVHKAVSSGSDSISIIDTSDVKGEYTEVTVSKSDLETISKKIENNNNINSVSIETSEGDIIIEKEVLNSILKNTDADSVSFEIEDAKDKLTDAQKEAVGDRPVYDINIKAGNENITSFDGKTITISLPYTLKAGEDPENIVVYYVKEDGSLEKMNCTYKDGKVIFETDHLSKYVIGYEESDKPITPDTPDDKKDDNNTIYYAVAAVIVILIIIALAYYFMKKKQ